MPKNRGGTGGENFDLRDILTRGRRMGFQERMDFFSGWVNGLMERGEALYLRKILSRADREVEIYDRFRDDVHSMLMFGSNNYLGLTSHPYVRERVLAAVREYGTGIGGPPLLNGYTKLHEEVEERISAFKRKEETVIFQSGYGANVGLLDSLTTGRDTVLYDAFSHASIYDGLRMSKAKGIKFAHNDMDEVTSLLEALNDSPGDAFLAVEGVYSMDGDIAPLEKLLKLCRRHEAVMILDDAHGTGVMGPTGRGTPQHFGIEEEIDIVMGTFSKAFGVVGASVSTSKEIADYLRFFGRSYMFSSSVPPAVLAAVLAGLDLIENNPEIHQRLRRNIEYTVRGLRRLGFDVHPTTAIIPLIVPRTMDLREAAFHFHRRGIFMNSIEYPAVPVDQQRFRISLMATHTKEDIDRLLEVVEEAWHLYDGKKDPEAPATPPDSRLSLGTGLA